MDISAIATSAAQAVQAQPAHHGHHQRRAAMDAAAQALGMSAADLRTALQGGKSLADLASAKGVSQSDLVSAIATALQKANPNLSVDQAKTIASRFATQKPGAANAGRAGAAGATDSDGDGDNDKGRRMDVGA